MVSVSKKHGRKKDHHGENTMTRGSRQWMCARTLENSPPAEKEELWTKDLNVFTGGQHSNTATEI